MPALERVVGTRVVADPAALDAFAAGLPATTVLIRPAPDDLFVVDLDPATVAVDDPHAIIEDERGFAGGWSTLDAIRRHLEWSPPTDRPVLAQGAVAGVPAKLWIAADDRVLVLTAAPHAAVLAERLGWTD